MIARLIDSCMLLGLEGEAQAQRARFRIAFPVEYGRWLAGQPVEDPPDAQWRFFQPAAGGATKLPDLPPCFSNTRTPVMTMPRSTALHMS